MTVQLNQLLLHVLYTSSTELEMKSPPPPPLLSITTSLPLLGLNRVTFGTCTRPGTSGMTVNEISHFPAAISNSPKNTCNVEKNYLTLTFFT